MAAICWSDAMRAVLKDGLLVLVPESDEETVTLEAWKQQHEDHVFHARGVEARGICLHDLGERAEACREPVNVVSTSTDPVARMIGNFAAAPFELDGQQYQSVESFWQGLKFADEADRRRLARLEAPRAHSEGDRKGYGATVRYGGQDIVVGTWAHWQLMERACRAKFEQNAQARAALLSTGERPLTHVLRRDSRSIPGAIMADIWMRIRNDLRERSR
jgi:predicted NAD-dependent protein-ADP-ribosyltransferase YbiA (DUF1768 family)